ncbi:MAG: hypothetical protein R2844_14075 [Caldilineales bacterium]
MIQQAIAHLLDRRDLSEDEAYAAMMEIMTGEATQAQIGGFLVALRMKGETVPEIAGCARHARQRGRRDAGQPALTDIVGTGGDHSGTFNISTTAAFVIAGAGAGRQTRQPLHHQQGGQRRCAGRAGRPAGHRCRAGGPLASTRRASASVTPSTTTRPCGSPSAAAQLAARTVFNILGPLTNPAGAEYMAIRVFSPDLTEEMAGVLGRMGSAAAFVVHGHGGLDELSLSRPNRVSELRDGGADVQPGRGRPGIAARWPGQSQGRRRGRQRPHHPPGAQRRGAARSATPCS